MEEMETYLKSVEEKKAKEIEEKTKMDALLNNIKEAETKWN